MHERNTGCLLLVPQAAVRPAPQAGALPGSPNGDPWLCGTTLNPLSLTSRRLASRLGIHTDAEAAVSSHCLRVLVSSFLHYFVPFST